VAGLRTVDLQRCATGPGVSQAQIEHLLAFGKALGGGGLQRLQLGVIMGRTEMLDTARTAPRPPHNLHRRRPRAGLHGAHIGHHRTLRDPQLVHTFQHDPKKTRKSTRRHHPTARNVAQVRFEVVGRWPLARVCTASLVQTNGCPSSGTAANRRGSVCGRCDLVRVADVEVVADGLLDVSIAEAASSD
jgi:hypothetical protein